MSSRDDFLDHVAMHVGKSKVATSKSVGEAFVVDSHKIQDRGMKIVNVDFVFHGPPTEFIGCAMHGPSFHASTGQEHGKSEWMMATSVLSFERGRTPEFAAPHNERFIEQAALL